MRSSTSETLRRTSLLSATCGRRTRWLRSTADVDAGDRSQRQQARSAPQARLLTHHGRFAIFVSNVSAFVGRHSSMSLQHRSSPPNNARHSCLSIVLSTYARLGQFLPLPVWVGTARFCARFYSRIEIAHQANSPCLHSVLSGVGSHVLY